MKQHAAHATRVKKSDLRPAAARPSNTIDEFASRGIGSGQSLVDIGRLKGDVSQAWAAAREKAGDCAAIPPCRSVFMLIDFTGSERTVVLKEFEFAVARRDERAAHAAAKYR